MKKNRFSPFILAIAFSATIAPTNLPAQVRSGASPSSTAVTPAPRQRPEPPAGWKSARPVGAELTMMRVAAANDDFWFGWTVGIPGNAFPDLTFSEAVAQADELIVASVEGFDSQVVSPEIPKKLDYHLLPGERTAILNLLRDYNATMQVYHVSSIPPDDASRRKLFDFAKDLNVKTIVCAAVNSEVLAALDKLASEFGINVALQDAGPQHDRKERSPEALMAAVQNRSKRIGLSADVGGWMEAGMQPVKALSIIKDRLLVLTLRDRTALGPGGSAVALANGAADLPDLFVKLLQLDIRPLHLMVGATGEANPSANLAQSLGGLENAMLPAMAARVRQVADSPKGAIHSPDSLSADMKAQIDAAIPRQAIAKPKQARKLLVMDLSAYTHATMQHMNLMLELMAKYTGAFEPVFSNDLSNLTYPKIKQFDAVFLNSVVGSVFNEPEVRAGLLQFVREGGGLGGNHGVTYASLNWPEFTQMLGGWSGEHHVETQTLKVDDPNSPLTAMFQGKGIEIRDEFYHFPMSSPYSRERLHVLLSIDVKKSDTATSGRMCPKCTRSDQDYGVSWIRSYGQGRVFCTPLGHTPDLYTSTAWGKHLLAAIQFILGDLEADTTPSAKLKATGIKGQ